METKNAPGLHRTEGALCSSDGSNGSVYTASLVARHIEITEEAFGCGFDVVVMAQAVPDGQGWEFRTHAEAMKWAQTIAQRHGWAIIDKSGGAHG